MQFSFYDMDHEHANSQFLVLANYDALKGEFQFFHPNHGRWVLGVPAKVISDMAKSAWENKAEPGDDGFVDLDEFKLSHQSPRSKRPASAKGSVFDIEFLEQSINYVFTSRI